MRGQDEIKNMKSDLEYAISKPGNHMIQVYLNQRLKAIDWVLEIMKDDLLILRK